MYYSALDSDLLSPKGSVASAVVCLVNWPLANLFTLHFGTPLPPLSLFFFFFKLFSHYFYFKTFYCLFLALKSCLLRFVADQHRLVISRGWARRWAYGP